MLALYCTLLVILLISAILGLTLLSIFQHHPLVRVRGFWSVAIQVAAFSILGTFLALHNMIMVPMELTATLCPLMVYVGLNLFIERCVKLVVMFNFTTDSIHLLKNKLLILTSFSKIQLQVSPDRERVQSEAQRKNSLSNIIETLKDKSQWFKKGLFSPTKLIAFSIAIVLTIPSVILVSLQTEESLIKSFNHIAMMTYFGIAFMISLICSIKIRTINENFKIRAELLGIQLLMLVMVIYMICALYCFPVMQMHQDSVCIVIIETQVIISALCTALLAKTKNFAGTHWIGEKDIKNAVDNMEKFEHMRKISNSLFIRLNEVLSDESLRESFEKFLIMEFSVEPILFWKTVQTFKSNYADGKSIDTFKALEYAKRIYFEFCTLDSDFAINISSECRRDIENVFNTEKPSSNMILSMFDNAEKEVLSLLSNDSLVRFLDQYKFLAPKLALKDPERKESIELQV